jgi:3',5'-cyclic AMP phosphodiesterase CpdA
MISGGGIILLNIRTIMKRYFFISVAVIISLLLSFTAEAGNKTKFDNKNVIIRFAAVSDTHMQGTDQLPSKKLVSALEQLNTKANGKLDVLLISGDLTDYGLPEQVVELKRVIEAGKVDLNKTRLVAALGNHEYYDHELRGNPWKGGYLLRDVFGNQAYNGAPESDIKASDYHTVVNGIDFIAVNCVQYSGGVKYDKSDLDWLREQLKTATAQRPGKPIFVASHPNITGTNFGSNEGDYWNARDLYDVLKDYPQVVYFCGHLHFPENDERSIWQGDFTTIGLGSTYYSSNHPVDDETTQPFIDLLGGYESSDAQKTSQGAYVEVDKNFNVKVTRLDFANKKEIKQPWIIPAPKADKSNLKVYTPEQLKKVFGKTAPVFPAGAVVKSISADKAKNEVSISFTQAKDNDIVYSYQVSFVEAASGKTLKTVSALSDFYLYSNPKDMAKSITKIIFKADSVLAPFGTGFKQDFKVKIIAVDCFGNKSKPLVSKVFNGIADNKLGVIFSPVSEDRKTFSFAVTK